MFSKNIFRFFVAALTLSGWSAADVDVLGQVTGKSWTIPLAGNVYRTAPNSDMRGLRRDGTLTWSSAEDIYSVYFHLDRAARVKLSLKGQANSGSATLSVSNGGVLHEVKLVDTSSQTITIGEFQFDTAGYVKIDLQGKTRVGENFGQLQELIAESSTTDLQLTCVATNEGNMFYWGRRGPSVHLSYSMPPDTEVEYAYSEIMVAEGNDPIGSYFMANGFGEGYFGIQVNSATERRVLFSVWSPFHTDNPKEIPEDQRVKLLARGPEVNTGEFGNEGSGGQSYLVYPWQAGRTYRFLTQVHPNADGTTQYTSWFGDKQQDEWRLIASFERPGTKTYLRGFHSFLENFNPSTGHQTRRGEYQNIWTCDVKGNWQQCTRARFSVDATGDGGHRLDFRGGVSETGFFLQNCGFFFAPVAAGTQFSLQASSDRPPSIDLAKLPRN